MSFFTGRKNYYKRLGRKAQAANNSILREFYEASWPSPNSDALKVPYTALDIETSGLNPKQHEILSIGMIDIDNGIIDLRTQYYRLVRPKAKQLDDKNVSIHQLTEEELAKASPIDDIFASIIQRLKGRIAIVHYHQIECGFLSVASRKLMDEDFEFPYVDTLSIERRRYPNQFGAEPYRLPNCCKRYGLPRTQMHNALSDALATAQLYLAQTAYAQGRGRRLRLKDMLGG